MIIGNPLLLKKAAASTTDPVTRSLRFDGSTSKLTRTPSSASSATACTISFWVKRGKTDEENTVFHAGTASGDRGHVRFNSNNTLEVACYNGSWFVELKTNAVYRDPSAFYHIFVSIDTTNGTGKLFVNGEEPSLQTNTTTSSSTVLPFGKTIEHQIGQRGFDSTGYHDGLLADFYFIDGTALSTPVGNLIEDTGYSSYKPLAFDMSSYSGNSFHLLFEDSSDIGADSTSNSNDFNPSGLVSADIREDNPFKNHATWNPLIKRSSTSNIFTYSEGNTVATYTGGVAHTSTTIASSGVHYAEFEFSGGTSSISGAGVVRARWNGGSADSYTTTYGGCYYGSSGSVNSPSGSTSVSAVGSNRLGIAFDGASNKADFYSVTSGGTMTLLKSLTSSDSIDFDGSATFTATSHDTGATSITGYFEEGEWWGTAPDVGSEAATSLNTSNLPAPTITPEENFNIALYNGTSSSNSITGLGFQPDLLYTKSRSTSGSSPKWYDSLRGVTKRLETNTAGAETTQATELTSFDSDGFTLGSDSGSNYSGRTYVGWCWKAHQTPPTPTSYSTTLTLTVDDLYGGTDSTGWGTTELEVFEGTQSLGTVGQPTYDSNQGDAETVYEIKTNDASKIKIVWETVDTSSDGSGSDRFYNIEVVLTDSSSNELASWYPSDYYGGGGYGPDAPEAGDVFRAQTSSADESTTGVLEEQGPTVNSNSEKYNAAAGFTMFTYTGNSSTDNDMMRFNHSLGVPIDFAIGKCRSSASGSGGKWVVWHKDLANDDGSLYLNETESENTTSGNNYDEDYGTIGWFQNVTSGTQHQVKIRNVLIYDGSNTDTVRMVDNSKNFIFYGFAGVEGYSSFGKYTGNGTTDGPFIYTGFRPAFVLWKRASGSSNSWNIMDNKREGYNPQNDLLFPDTQGNESNVTDQDLLSNGFKMRTTGAGRNANNETFIYAAFAESPLKYSNAR